MRGAYWIVGTVSLLLIGLVVFLVTVAGGNYYLRVLKHIYTSPKEDRSQMKVDFFATDRVNTHGGILAGVHGKRVWVWGKGGLKSYLTYQDSVYLYKDRCSEGARESMKAGYPADAYNMIETNLDTWQASARQGDYVVVITPLDNPKLAGNLREIHTYNYYPFLRGDMDTLCAK